jgi:hypothetical protein
LKELKKNMQGREVTYDDEGQVLLVKKLKTDNIKGNFSVESKVKHQGECEVLDSLSRTGHRLK